MSAYEILKALSKYRFLIEHQANAEWPCNCEAGATCQFCDEHELYEVLDGILRKVSKYAF